MGEQTQGEISPFPSTLSPQADHSLSHRHPGKENPESIEVAACIGLLLLL